jgi:nucleotide-binding universal stress UspA family protein
MVQIQRILYPTDFSETSRHALDQAVAIARWYESRLIALHVIQAPLFPQPPLLFAGIPKAPSVVSEHQAREEELRAWLEPAHRAGVKTDLIVEDGNPVSRILDRAKSRGADLIVMGTHGLSGFERFILGSVAEKVLRKATCPVLTVPPASQTTAKIPYTRLLCPVDFSESSLTALRFAFSIAKEADARLTILHVAELRSDDDLLVQQFDTAEYRHLVAEEARGRLEALVTADVREWCQPSMKIAYGKPYREILETAEKEASDLIVIGVRGRTPMGMAMVGSTTNQVVRSASCPVMTLRA